MLDSEIATQLRELVPSMDMPADPMAALQPRIRRRRVSLVAAGAGGLAVVAIAAAGLSTLVLDGGSNQLSPATDVSSGVQTAPAYQGPALPQIGNTPSWVIAHRITGKKTLDILYFRQDGQNCLGTATTDTGTASPTPAVDVETQCGSFAGLSIDIPFNAESERGPNSVLYGRAPAGTQLVRASLSGGRVVEPYLPVVAIPLDAADRFFALNVAGSGGLRLTGQLTFLDASGRVIGHADVDVRTLVGTPSSGCPSPPPTPQQNTAEACANTGTTH